MSDFASDSYLSNCCWCQSECNFIRKSRAIRETYLCTNCGVNLRERELLRAVGIALGMSGDNVNVNDVVVRLSAMRVFEPGFTGPFRERLRLLDNYYASCYDGHHLYHKDNFLNFSLQDIQSLSFDDGFFDFIISSEILEHVPSYENAFKEIRRVLKVGGYHVFSIPFQIPVNYSSVIRSSFVNEILKHNLEEIYHGDGADGKALVFTDFGMDIIHTLSDNYFSTLLLRANTDSAIANRVLTFVTRRVI